MKPKVKLSLGLVLIVLSVLTLLIALVVITPTWYVDFPCFGEQVREQNVSVDTRIVYCISAWPLRAISGGAIYDTGAATEDEIQARQLKFKREDRTVYVNDRPVRTGESYKATRVTPSLNPWLVFTTEFAIRNEGITPIGSSTPVDALYISGDATEGWIPNPAGLVMLGIGIWLVWRGRKERKQARPVR